MVLHYPGDIGLCARPHRRLNLLRVSRVQLSELGRVIELLPVGVIFAGVVAAAWLIPT
jgi:hypothetical protein